MPKKCPLNKDIHYTAGRNWGVGYPEDWAVRADFQDCIEDQCAFWSGKNCGLVNNNKQLFSDEFLTKLP